MPEGLLSGHTNFPGDFDECVGVRGRNLNISAPFPDSLRGKYCNMYSQPEIEQESTRAVSPTELFQLLSHAVGIIMYPSVGVCFPSSCSNEDMTILTPKILAQFGIPVLATHMYCATDEKPNFDAADYSVASLLCVFIFLCLVAGMLDKHLWGANKSSNSGLVRLLLCFSFYTNIQKWGRVVPSADDLGCLHGIRVLSTAWVVLGHTFSSFLYTPFWNMVEVKKIHESWSILTIMNSSVSVDTFFVMSGMLVTVSLLKLLDKSKGKLNVFMFYVHRYLRITPLYAVVIGVVATLHPYTGSGPYWDFVEIQSTNCQSGWWKNLLYINNIVDYTTSTDQCLPPTWYLANDMQFYILSPLFIYPLWRWKKWGLGLLTLASLASVACPAAQVYLENVPPTLTSTRVMGSMNEIYVQPWARIQTYFVGMWLGLIFHWCKGREIQLPKVVVAIGWIGSTATCLVVIYGIGSYFDYNYEIPRVEGAIYAGLHRVAWGVAISWVIFACVKGYGGLVNEFLSWSAFVPLGRVCYSVYLIHLPIIAIFVRYFRQPVTYTPYLMTNLFLSNLMMAFLLGFLVTICIESPFIALEKLLFEGNSKNTKPQETNRSNNEEKPNENEEPKV